jgi:phage gp46-like protein
MMALDLAFDPITKDLVDGDGGTFAETERADTAVLLQLESHLAEWWGDADAGSLLHDRDRFQADPEPLITDEARRALAVLESEGMIDTIEVRAELAAFGRVNVATSFRDVTTNSLVDLLVEPGV